MSSKQQNEVFLSVIESHKGILYKVACTYCKNVVDRNDLLQEIIIQLWKAFDRYNPEYKYSTWIYRIALNVAISFYRKETSRKVISNPLTEHILNFPEDNLFNEKEQQLTVLQQFIAALKEFDKALLLLYLDEKTYKEIAEITGITETNVATRISRIKNNLKQQFAGLKQ